MLCKICNVSQNIFLKTKSAICELFSLAKKEFFTNKISALDFISYSCKNFTTPKFFKSGKLLQKLPHSLPVSASAKRNGCLYHALVKKVMIKPWLLFCWKVELTFTCYQAFATFFHGTIYLIKNYFISCLRALSIWTDRSCIHWYCSSRLKLQRYYVASC